MNIFKPVLLRFIRYMILYFPDYVVFAERDRRVVIVDRKNRAFEAELMKILKEREMDINNESHDEVPNNHENQRLGQYLINRLAPRAIFYVGNTELLRLIDEWKMKRPE